MSIHMNISTKHKGCGSRSFWSLRQPEGMEMTGM